MGVLGAGLGRWTLDNGALVVAEGAGEHAEAPGVDHPAVPAEI